MLSMHSGSNFVNLITQKSCYRRLLKTCLEVILEFFKNLQKITSEFRRFSSIKVFKNL